MRKLAIAVALSTSLLASPAMARDGAFYIGAEFGPMIVEDIDFDLTAGTTTTSDAITIDADRGFDGDVIVGYDFGAFRLEAEVAYKENDLDTITNSTRIGTPNSIAAGTRTAQGEVIALSAMVNGMLDFGDDDGVQGFIGGGAGIARVKTEAAFFSNLGFIDDSDTKFAYQVIAGIRAPVSRGLDVGIKYRFFNVDDIRGVNINNNTTEARYRSHSLLGSFIVNFGGEAPVVEEPVVETPVVETPVETPVAETPPPAVPAGPFIVFFDWDQAEITPQAAAILDNAASAYQQTGNANVLLAGNADKSGSNQYNIGLSQRRADNVRQYLSGRGIPEGVMTTQAFGEEAPLVDTADGVREPQNRNVQITFGPGSGQ